VKAVIIYRPSKPEPKRYKVQGEWRTLEQIANKYYDERSESRLSEKVRDPQVHKDPEMQKALDLHEAKIAQKPARSVEKWDADKQAAARRYQRRNHGRR
jgi:hypothetical protein